MKINSLIVAKILSAWYLIALLHACSTKLESADTDMSEHLQPGTAAPFAFRSALDGKIRVLTVPVSDDLWVAYDTSSAQLYKAWQGDILLQGAVYDTVHGPQPVAQESAYYQSEDMSWQLLTDSQARTIQLNYRGYTLKGDEVTLLYDYVADDGWVATIEETPSQNEHDDNLALVRHFRIAGLPPDTKLLLDDIILPASFRVAGAGELNRITTNRNTTDSSGDQHDSPHTADQRGSLRMGNGITRVELAVAWAPKQDTTEGEHHPGLLLINSSDCAACHNETLTTVGPSYRSIARRYQDSDDTTSQLRDKIIDGGSGVWGHTVMTPHPNLTKADADQMVTYILSLDDGASGDDENPWSLGQKSVPVILEESTPSLSDDTQGAFVYLHYFNGDQPDVEQMRTAPPAMAALTPQIHLRDIDAFAPEKVHFAYQVKTHLRIANNTTKTIRLVSDDGAYLYLNERRIIDNWGFHGPEAADATVQLKEGDYPLEIIYFQGTSGASLSLQWFNEDTGAFELVPDTALVAKADDYRETVPVITDEKIVRSIPGDRKPLVAVHPAFNLAQARPDEFQPMVGGIDFFSDGRMVVCTWDAHGSVYMVENYTAANPDHIKVKRIAAGLAEPLGIKVVDDELYVLQKQELTKLVDDDGDGIIDRYLAVSNGWTATDNFHEFAFGLEYRDGYFYATLAAAVAPGGASVQPQAPDRGTVMKINKSDGSVEFLAHGLRTPNGIGAGVDNALFVADNQGDWLPSSKIVEVTPGAWYGSRSVDFEGTANLEEVLPVVWLPQDEIGNSPSEPARLNVGPYQNQMIHGEVTHGGIKRVFAESVGGRLQGAVFRFSQGLEAGVNRMDWAPDGSLIVGGVGNPGNWSHEGKAWYGLQRLTYNGRSVFEILSVSARSNGFEIEFTEPVKAGQNISAKDFQVQQWRYQPTEEYGGPKLDLEELKANAFSLSKNRKRATFELNGLKAGHVVYFRIARPFQSELGHELWTTEAWYTLNTIPEGKPVTINRDYSIQHNRLTEEEVRRGWKLLFDGKSTAGLRNYNADTLGSRWTVDGHALHLTGRTSDESGWQTPDGGDLVITDKPYENYELYLEWKLQKNGNSGIIYNVAEGYDQPFLTGPEFQLLDNTGHPDGQIDKHRAGDNYDLIESKFVAVNDPGEWNRVNLVVNNGHVEHWLNGYKVVETEMWTPEWTELVADSKFSDWEYFGTVREGHIVLQDHGDKVWFRNIKIRELQ